MLLANLLVFLGPACMLTVNSEGNKEVAVKESSFIVEVSAPMTGNDCLHLLSSFDL